MYYEHTNLERYAAGVRAMPRGYWWSGAAEYFRGLYPELPWFRVSHLATLTVAYWRKPQRFA